MSTFFLVMFAACSMALLYFLVRLFQNRRTHAPDSATHQAFLDEMERSVWKKVAKRLGLEVEALETEVLLCQHTLRGSWKGRPVRIRSFDRGHAGRVDHPSSLRVAMRQKRPERGLQLGDGLETDVVHGQLAVTYTGDKLLGMGPWLGEKAVRLRHEDDWLEIEARARPDELPELLDEIQALFARLERESHPQWVEAARSHGLRLAWEEGRRRHPRLEGSLGGGGVRVSVLQGQGIQAMWVGAPGLNAVPARIPGAQLQGDTLRVLLPEGDDPDLVGFLSQLKAAAETGEPA